MAREWGYSMNDIKRREIIERLKKKIEADWKRHRIVIYEEVILYFRLTTDANNLSFGGMAFGL